MKAPARTRRAPEIAVVGPGAIGTTIAGALHEAGNTPRLCGRTARDGVELVTPDAPIAVPGPVLIDPRNVRGFVNVVFLAVKATQIDVAAPWLTVLCGPGTVLCVLQNGVEQIEMLSPHVPREPRWFRLWSGSPRKRNPAARYSFAATPD